jgi:hypothetical protein
MTGRQKKQRNQFPHSKKLVQEMSIFFRINIYAGSTTMITLQLKSSKIKIHRCQGMQNHMYVTSSKDIIASFIQPGSR